jgi:exosortase A-associated hydrolase 2
LNRSRVCAEFVAGERGRIFTLTRMPARTVRGTLLVVPAFAEEMNKTRRMLSEATVALADAGFGSVLVDLYGTGDSDGEFGDANWDGWVRDLATADEHSTARGAPITHVLAVRAGCLLAAAYLRDASRRPRHCVFWQPVIDGSRYMDQFLRLRLAGGLLGDAPKETLSSLRARLIAAGTLEVAGYDLPAALETSIGGLRLPALLASGPTTVEWVEVLRSTDTSEPAATKHAIAQTRESGCEVRQSRVTGDQFWATTEVTVVPELRDLTLRLISGEN